MSAKYLNHKLQSHPNPPSSTPFYSEPHISLSLSSPGQARPARAMQVQTVTITVVWSVIPWVKLPTNYHLNYNLHLHGSNSYIINHRVGAGTKIF